jgi:sugar/nucleoside kinase (ribokinase family)
MSTNLHTVVAGHICLDVIPSLDHLAEGSLRELFHPGHLISAGPAAFSTGGPVSNTGLALFRLGIPTRLVARVGDDPFGGIVRALVEKVDPALASGLVTVPGETTSYTVIISPPHVDRIFIHCTGANDSFGAEDIDPRLLEDAALFHFGYPPAMRRMYTGRGEDLVEVLKRARSSGATISLDTCLPDPYTGSGQADWPAILANALPYVDVFLPSLEEILFMLDPYGYAGKYVDARIHNADMNARVTTDLLSDLSARLLEMGAKIVVIKLGSRGLYLRTAGIDRLREMGRAAPEDLYAWADVELWAPCFQVNVVGTTGSGDATIAGFLSALLRGFSPQRAVTAAVAVGACNVEAADALSGIRGWEETLARVDAGWKRHKLRIKAPGWSWDAIAQVNVKS